MVEPSPNDRSASLFPSFSLGRDLHGLARCLSAAVFLLALCVALPAHAGSRLLGGRGFLTVPLASTIPRNNFELSLWTNTFVNGGGVTLTPSPFSVGLGVLDDLELTAATEFVDKDDPEWGLRQTYPITLGLKYRYFDETALWPGMAVELRGERIDKTFDFLPRWAIQKRFFNYLAGLSVGYRAAYQEGSNKRRGLLLGAGIQRTYEDGQLLLEVTGELRERDNFKGGRITFGLLGSVFLVPSLDFSVAAVGGLGRETTDVRVFAGLTYASLPERMVDTDGDGIEDYKDECVFEKEIGNGFADHDGCPDDGLGPAKKEEKPRFESPRPRFKMKIPERTIPGDPRRNVPVPAPAAPKRGQEQGAP